MDFPFSDVELSISSVDVQSPTSLPSSSQLPASLPSSSQLPASLPSSSSQLPANSVTSSPSTSSYLYDDDQYIIINNTTFLKEDVEECHPEVRYEDNISSIVVSCLFF